MFNIKLVKINNSLFKSENYIDNEQVLSFKQDYYKYFDNILKRIINYKNYKKYKNINKIIDELNNNFIKSNLDNEILKNVNGYELDNEQKTAVLTDETNELVIAGAGSGKSLTIIGKIRYLIECKNIKEEEILCISFTKESTKDLQKNFEKNYNYNIDILTFHKLALNILSYYNNELNIAPSDYLEYIVDEIFYDINKDISSYLKKNIVTFIKLFKAQGLEEEYFEQIYLKNKKMKNKTLRDYNELIIRIIESFYYIYTNELSSQNMYDFDDLIIEATKVVKEKGIYKNYKYIIIDEFQDTSYTRFNLIKEIKNVCNSKVLAVGDDFQSIYHFTGCSLDIFLNFENFFGYTKIVKIQNTYRNSNQLIEVAGNFVMQNNKQIKKNLKSIKNLNKPIKIYYYKKEEELVKLLELIYEKNKTNILVLSRNKTDIDYYLNSNLIKKGDNLIIKNKEHILIKLLTVHKSKGLEEDNVVLINLNSGKLGFPSKITNEDILKYILKEDDSYPYAEERRLFYVALTRTKNNVYLFLNKKNESIFAREIINNNKKYIEFLNN